MDRRTTLVYFENGTTQITPEEGQVPAFAASLIIFISFLLAVVYNFIVITAIIYSLKLRNCSFHVVFASLSATCMIDCLTNESVAFALLFVEPFELCATSAVFFHVFLLVHLSSLGLLCVERTFLHFDRPLSLKMCLVGLLVAWFYGLVFSVFFLDNPEVHYFPNRNSCSAVGSNNYLPIFTLIGLVLSWGVVLFCMLLYLFFAYTVPKNVTQSFNLPVLPVLNISRRSVNLNTNLAKTKLTCIIVFLYVILIFPLSISVVVELFSPPIFLLDPWNDPRKSNAIRSVSTQSMEPLFTYSRYMYNASVPIMILISDRDVRVVGRSIFCCKRNEIAITNSFETEAQSKTLAPEPITSDTPVLFATSQGIFLMVSQKTVLPINQEEASTSGVDLKLSPALCDSSSAPLGENEVKRSLTGIEEKEEGGSVSNKINLGLSSRPRSFSPPVERSSPTNTHTVVNSPVLPNEGLVLYVHSGRTYSKL